MDPLLIVPISSSNRVAPQQDPALHVGALEESLHFHTALRLQNESQPIQNSDRSVGTGLSGELMRRRKNCLPGDEEIRQNFHGSAGPSLRPFLSDGRTRKLQGEANPYPAQRLSRGT